MRTFKLVRLIFAISAVFIFSAPVASQSYFPSMPNYNSDGFTAEELRQIDYLVQNVEQACAAQLAPTQRTAAQRGSTQPWASKLVSADLCQCSGAEVRYRVTPTLLRSGTQQQGADLVMAASTSCAVRKLKSVFPEICRSIVDQIPTGPKSTKHSTNQAALACQCAQKSIDSVSESGFSALAKETFRDYELFRKDPSRRAKPNDSSLVGTIRNCAVKAGIGK